MAFEVKAEPVEQAGILSTTIHGTQAANRGSPNKSKREVDVKYGQSSKRRKLDESITVKTEDPSIVKLEDSQDTLNAKVG